MTDEERENRDTERAPSMEEPESLESKMDRMLAFMSAAASEFRSLREDFSLRMDRLEADRSLTNRELRNLAARILRLEAKYANLIPSEDLLAELAEIRARCARNHANGAPGAE